MTTVHRTEKAVEIIDGTKDRMVLTNCLGNDLVIAYTDGGRADDLPTSIHDLVAIDLVAAVAIIEFLQDALPCPDHFVGAERLTCETCGGTR